jgi:hypothetical protein
MQITKYTLYAPIVNHLKIERKENFHVSTFNRACVPHNSAEAAPISTAVLKAG